MANKKHTSIRVEEQIMNAVGLACSMRPGNISSNTWIIEAIVEKLEREGVQIEGAKSA